MTTESNTKKDYYFDSYSHFGIHEEMLKDEVRTMSYRNAIYRNRHLFEDKVVLDIGCGTGILSMFAATAGARLVIGVDMSDMIDHAKVIVNDNKLSDKIVLLKGKMEEVVLPVEKVDIIISEWMGYFLLYESMLDTVIWARDKYLNPESGLIFPDKAELRVAAIEDAEYKEQKIHFWDSVYGFDMNAIKPLAMREPLVDVVDGKACVSTDVVFKTIDIKSVTKEELDFKSEFVLKVTRSEHSHGLVAWFSVSFPGTNDSSRAVSFSTGPYDKQTHWKQTVFYFPEDLFLTEGDKIKCSLSCSHNAVNPRNLDIDIKYELEGKTNAGPYSYSYMMA